ncbi:MAG: type II toxin-antitoxin system RelE/ParE family toxin [Deltaproteobacteria bacterium]
MIVFLLSSHKMMKQIIQLAAFKKEISDFPIESREDIFSLIYRFLSNERLGPGDFKTFNIDKNIRIQEFKVKDSKGNWRAIPCLYQKTFLVLVYAFHKKTQELQERDKNVIRKRIKDISI